MAKGVPIRRISIDLGISRNTVSSYFLQETLSPRKSSKSTNIELFTNHIVARLNNNGYKISDIINEIREEMGFYDQESQAYYNINTIKENFDLRTPGFSQVQYKKTPYVKPLSSRMLAKYVGSPLTEIIDSLERYYLKTLLENINEIKIVRKLVQIFKTMLVRGRGNIKRWIEFVKRS